MTVNQRIELLVRDADSACHGGQAEDLRSACGELANLLPAVAARRASRVVKLAFEDPWTAAEEWKELSELLKESRWAPARRVHRPMS